MKRHWAERVYTPHIEHETAWERRARKAKERLELYEEVATKAAFCALTTMFALLMVLMSGLILVGIVAGIAEIIR